MVAIASGAKRRRQCTRIRLDGVCLIISIIVVAFIPLWIMMRKQADSMNETLAGASTTRTSRLVPSNIIMPHVRFHFLQQQDRKHINSDVVELRHCNLHELDWNDYFTWASRILNEKMPQFHSNKDYTNFTHWQDMEQEFILELLEMYATFHGKCRFDTGYPFVPPTLPKASQVFRNVVPTVPSTEFARLAIAIIAFTDAPQLQLLVKNIHMPHYYIVIHVERRSSTEFLEQVHDICSEYQNVVLVQFGTIIYRTDLISNIQLQLMKWMSSSLVYDYYVTLNGAAYPLYSAEELALHLKSSKRNVWLGELTHGKDGSVVRNSQAGMLVGAKRLAYTRGNTTKGTFRLSQALVALNMSVSPAMEEAVSFKTVSGNQGVYSFEVVNQLLSSPSAMQLFALAKYGCCGVLEERSWIAAMHLIGVGQEARHEPGAVWQVWGGKSSTCESSVNNAILTTNSTTCFKVEDATRGMERKEGTALYIHGNEILDYLKDAKKRGFLFARKFQSTNIESMKLLETIRNEIHNS